VSSTTWTPRAVASSAQSWKLDVWRAVEWQHVAATTKLVDTKAEQELLEDLLDETKPPAPFQTAGLDYLLATPFRYPAPKGGSRFRGPADPGVFYAADETRTACAELGYWRWRFLTDSEGLEAFGPVPHTVFQVKVQGVGVDLRRKPLVRDSRKWLSRNDYSATQAFAVVARSAELALIRYESVRDPRHGGCAAILSTDAFSPRKPLTSQKWLLTVTRSASIWQRDSESFEFRWP
jgi:hypothetical protein